MCLFVTKKTLQFCWRRAESCTLTRTPPQRHRRYAPSDERWGGGINKIRPCGGQFHSGHGKKGKISVTHNFKINPRQKLDDAVACASVAPMQLHRPIHHAVIYKQLIIARQRRNGGGLITLHSSPTSPVLGIIFRSLGRHPKQYCLKATARPQIRFCEKLRETKNN